MARVSRFRPVYGLVVSLLLSDSALSRIVPQRDARQGILDAALVVIVKPQTATEYEIEEAFWGDASPGDSIHLPGFRLFTMQRYGPDLVEPISPGTRILLFLQHKKEDPSRWEPTQHGYCCFWVHDPGRVFELRNIAQEAMALRQRWEEAASIPDPRQRVEALWPYLRLMQYGSRFFERTKLELHKAGPVAGDYFAEQFDEMSRQDRSLLYHEAAAYGSEALHQTLIHHIKSQQQLYEHLLVEHGLDGKAVLEDWNNISEEIRNIYGEVYYALAGLAGFKDRNDLPMIREVALWAVEHGLGQTCEAALGAFRNMPDKSNLPIIEAIWKEYAPLETEGNRIIRYEVIRSLTAHLFPETIPLLAPFVTDSFAGPEVRDALSKIVGQDLSGNPRPWLDWYQTYQLASPR